MFKIKLILIITILLGGYLYFSNPKSVVINEKGKVKGLVNKARAMLQCEKFWQFQFTIATKRYNKNLSPNELSFSELNQQLEQRQKEDERALDNKMKDIISPEERIAQSLRREADRIERMGEARLFDEMIESYRLKEIERLKIVIPIIKVKLQNAKPSITPIILLFCVVGLASIIIITKVPGFD